MGRELGVMDLQSDLQNGGAPQVGWDWYVFGGQRFARVRPGRFHQPIFHSRDAGRRERVDQQAPVYIALSNALAPLAQLPDSLRWPLDLYFISDTVSGAITILQVAEFLALYPDSLVPTGSIAKRGTFFGHQMVSLPRAGGGEDVVLSLEEVVAQGSVRSGTSGVPFIYVEHSTNTLPAITYYIHDHLGNTRLTYTTGCTAPDHEGNSDVALRLDHAVDYLPYGGVLREYVTGRQEKYLSTHHERDVETGLDYRGARFYDSDVARFLSLDPLAADYASWSAYNYVMGNPISLVDPDGRQVHDYRLNANGKIEFVRLTNDDFDRLFYSGHDGKGGIESGSVEVQDRGLLPSLQGYGHAETSRGEDAFRLFQTLAKGSDVEWRFTGFNFKGIERFELHTDFSAAGVTSALFIENQTISMHSHTGFGMEGSGASGRYPNPAKLGDQSDQAAYAAKKAGLNGKEPAPHFVYHPYSDRMSQYNEKVKDFNVDYNKNRCLGDYYR